MLLKGKVVLITGAAGGIGKAIASEMLAEGAITILSDYSKKTLDPVETELSSSLNLVDAIALDVTSIESIKNGIQHVIEKYGHLDILINNAGICKLRPALDITPEDWDLVFGVNLKGLFFRSGNINKNIYITIWTCLSSEIRSKDTNFSNSPQKKLRTFLL